MNQHEIHTDYSAVHDPIKGILCIKAAGTFPTHGYSFKVDQNIQNSIFTVNISVISPKVTQPEEFAFPEHQEELRIPNGCKSIIITASNKEDPVYTTTL